jgi:hypothetical protein
VILLKEDALWNLAPFVPFLNAQALTFIRKIFFDGEEVYKMAKGSAARLN